MGKKRPPTLIGSSSLLPRALRDLAEDLLNTDLNDSEATADLWRRANTVASKRDLRDYDQSVILREFGLAVRALQRFVHGADDEGRYHGLTQRDLDRVNDLLVRHRPTELILETVPGGPAIFGAPSYKPRALTHLCFYAQLIHVGELLRRAVQLQGYFVQQCEWQRCRFGLHGEPAWYIGGDLKGRPRRYCSDRCRGAANMARRRARK